MISTQTPLRGIRRRFALIGACTFVAYLALGWIVSGRPPTAFDLAFVRWFGVAPDLAWILTNSGFLPTLVLVGAVALAIGLRFRAWLPRAVFAVALNIVGWAASDAFKAVFHRTRPAHWLRLHETSYSYASGHSTDAVVVYALWALFLVRSELPRFARISAGTVLVAWALGVSWSRLALGVHYPTDVLGGWLLGMALLGAGFALYPSMLKPPPVRADGADIVHHHR